MSDNNKETSSCFWLPSEFFTDDDFLMENENKNTSKESSVFSFPYHLETNKNHEKNYWAMSTSPQSTLSHYRSSTNGSPQEVHSPPTTPFVNENDDVRDLIHKAANHVATLNFTRNFGPNYLGPLNSNTPFLNNSHFQGTILQDPTRFVVGSGSVKRKCAGTGVFLPRINPNGSRNRSYISDSHKKPGCSFGLVPDRSANLVQSQPVSQPQFNQGFNQNYELLIARRNSIILQRRAMLIAERSLMMNRDMYLPQEWTY